MCKVIIFTNAKKLDVKHTVNVLGNMLLNTEPDGFGYCVQGEQGIFGERSVDKSFDSRLGLTRFNPVSLIKNLYDMIGSQSKPIGPMLLHGRVSTNESGLVNTHPMERDGNFLIHNGVVTDYGPDYTKATDNDSEDLLVRFLEGIESVEDHLTGYYAFGMIDTKGQLHIVKDSVADLYLTWSSTAESFIFATSKAHLKAVSKRLKLEIGPIDAVANNTYCIFSGNDLIHNRGIEPRGWDYTESAYAEKSLGKVLDGHGNWENHSADVVTPKSYNNDITDQQFQEDIELFCEEEFKALLVDVDDTCNILDNHNRKLTASEFHKLDFEQQKECLIMTKRGEYIEYHYHKSA